MKPPVTQHVVIDDATGEEERHLPMDSLSAT
jgi:hypothetical protein